ncbi:SGNH/GDSL hydrolase family protein [Bacillus salipaludis]|uniref:SGNH/GDSL hydrolase family protein n=1 Tax=Bacillus salipaludis TaxID=2547811 RepID=A0ABW8RPV4_9BACI
MNLKFLSFLGVLMLVGSLFTSSVNAKSENAKKSLVALGDSITYGYNLDNNNHPSKAAFPSVMGRQMDTRVRNLGVEGWPTHQLLMALKEDEKFRQAVRHADVVTLNIGSNDFLHGLLASIENPDIWPGVTTNMLKNIGDIMTEIQALTDAKIVVYNIFNPFPADSGVHAYVDYLLPPINEGIKKIALGSGENVVFADAYEAFGNDQAIYIIQDDNHPTALGHELLAKIGFEALNFK